MTKPIRVLVVDDSALMRRLITDILRADPAIEVVGQARDGADGVQKVRELRPDVVTLDVEMPVMDGMQTLAEIMRSMPTATIMLSSLTHAGAETTLRCLALGAVDFVGKPSGSISMDIATIGQELLTKVKMACKVRPILSTPTHPVAPAPVRAGKASNRLVVIGSSTGGPQALHNLLPHLPGNIGVPIVLVQHLPPLFTTMLATRLNQECQFTVREAAEGDTLQPGVALLAPGGKHLSFDSRGIARLTMEPPVHGVRPAFDVTLSSLVTLHGPRAIGVILTGMGKDGALAMKALHDRGGETIAQDEETSIVFGMPKAAIDSGGIRQVLPLSKIPAAIMHAISERPATGAAVHSAVSRP